MTRRSDVQLGLQPWGESIAELTGAASRGERAGFTSVWTSELHRSAFIHAGAIAGATRSATVATGIALAFVRSPLALALTALDLADVSDGRFILGLGSGVHRLNRDWHGVEVTDPVARLRAVVETVRELMAALPEGRPVCVDGDPPIRIEGLHREFAPRNTQVPIFLGTVGPKMTRLAGEVADGWLGHQLMSTWYLRERVLPELQPGRRRSNRSFTTVASACCVPHEDRVQARRWAAGVVAFYASVRTYAPFFAAHGFDAEAAAIRERFRAGDERGMLAAVPDAMVDMLTIAGPPREVRDRVAELGRLVDVVKLAPPTHLVPPEVTREVQERIIATVADG